MAEQKPMTEAQAKTLGTLIVVAVFAAIIAVTILVGS